MNVNKSQAQTQNEQKKGSRTELIPTSQVFNFENPLEAILIKGEPWFVAKDICDILGLQNPTDRLRDLEDYQKLTYVLHRSGQNRELNIINESGLYSLIFKSNKPEAKAFQKWVTTEVLPSIRKTGKYDRLPKRALIDLRPEEKELLLMLKKYLKVGDNQIIAKELKITPGTVSRVKRGTARIHRVMDALIKLAKKNKASGKHATGYSTSLIQTSLDFFNEGGNNG